MTVITEEVTEEQQRVSAETRPVSGAKVPPPRQSAGTEARVTPVSGVVDIADGRAGYLRTAGYRRSATDLPLTAGQIRAYGLRKGDRVDGVLAVSAKANGTNGNGASSSQRAKGGALADVTAVNGLPPDQARTRRHFDDLTPIYPHERFRLEDGDPSPAARIIDLVSPIGKGQRGLIVAPPKAGKTTVLKTIAHAIATAYPDVQLMLVLVGERPEEVTDLRRSVRGEVISSTFDQSPADHVLAAELAIERAKRLAELGRDVVVMLDSLTRLGRAYNLAAPASSRTLSGGVAASALQPPRQFLGAARCLEEGGSLTILSTALIDTGSQLDNVLFEEFKGTGNMELRLRRDLAEKRLFPAIDPVSSGTRREDLLVDPAEHAAVISLRRALAALDPQHALELLLEKTTAANAEFLRQVRQSR
ncbi:MAG TPA: transcription termination factor Rho [Trebonia sp.]|nr:transcription termination factor Rho [Trebonia sp.]